MIKMITYPLNNIDYTAEDAELYFSTRESGVYDGNDFEVTVSGVDNDVIVGTGIAWIHNTKFSGKVVALKEPKTLTLSLPNSVYDRIDAIVIQFDANENATDIIVKEGVASSKPVAPNVVRTESLYELHIFHVQRIAGETVIDVDNLVDLRNNSDYCGIMFDPISSIDSTLTKSGYAADAAETGKQIKRATTVLNLLDNSDFRNPVNQRGESSYKGTGGKVYTVDRWLTWSTNTISIVNGGISVTANSSGGNGHLQQYIHLSNIDVNKIYTAAAETIDGDICCVSGKFSEEFGVAEENNILCYTDTNNNIAIFQLGSGTYKWAALYEGEYTAETLPPYVPKEESTEIAQSQLCWQWHNGAPIYVPAYNNLTVYFPTPMRIAPTVILSSGNGVQCGLAHVTKNGFTLTNTSNNAIAQIYWEANAEY
jgi:hypothetical protein